MAVRLSRDTLNKPEQIMIADAPEQCSTNDSSDSHEVDTNEAFASTTDWRIVRHFVVLRFLRMIESIPSEEEAHDNLLHGVNQYFLLSGLKAV